MSSSEQHVAPIDKNAGPMHNKCRRLHDTKIAPSTATTATKLEQYISFRARFITKSNKDES